MRIDRRANDEIRLTRITTGAQAFADGSALIEMGNTRVLCAASIEDRVPPFLKGQGRGWVTAEYAMLPRSTHTRTAREISSGRPSSRSQEIQRLIGRSLRAATNMGALGERTLTVDCDVIQADGGTRTASITGGYVALYQALLNLVRKDFLKAVPLHCAVAAISAGIIDQAVMLDLCYEEDSRAGVDFNVVMTDKEELVEIQGTAEGEPFTKTRMDDLVEITRLGILELFRIQSEAIEAL